MDAKDRPSKVPKMGLCTIKHYYKIVCILSETNFLRYTFRFIHSKNRQGLSYRLAVNHLADMSKAELKMRNGYRHTPGDHGAQVFDKASVDPNTVPDSIDWRILGNPQLRF